MPDQRMTGGERQVGVGEDGECRERGIHTNKELKAGGGEGQCWGKDV